MVMVRLEEFQIPTEGIRFQNSDVLAQIGDSALGRGTLYVAESALYWKQSSTGEGFKLDYTEMCLHAISRDEKIYERGCIYIMVNGKFCGGDENEISGEDDDSGEGSDEDPDPEEDSTEIKLSPDDESLLSIIYSAIQDCSLLHPDSASDMSQEESEGDEEGEEDLEEGMSDDEDEDEYYNGHRPGVRGAGDGTDASHHPNQFADAD